MVKFKDWLRQEVQKRNIEQKEFAHIAGITQGQVSKYLKGFAEPAPLTIVRIAEEWKIPQKDLLLMCGYDENYKRLPKTGSDSEEIIPITPDKSDDDTYMNEHLDALFRELQRLAFDKDKNLILSTETKKAIIGFLEYVIENEKQGRKK
jgi:transcriptional regulator with XRE-family HTH domain